MSPEKKKQIREYLDSLNKQEQIWASGYLDGVLNGTASLESDSPKPLRKIKKLPLHTERNRAIPKKLPTCLRPAQNRKVFTPNW